MGMFDLMPSVRKRNLGLSCLLLFNSTLYMLTIASFSSASALPLANSLASKGYNEPQSAVDGTVNPSFDDEWRQCVNGAQPMTNVDWNKMYGVWFADTASDASDRVTCAMTRFDKLAVGSGNGILVTKLFTRENQQLEEQQGAIGHDGSENDMPATTTVEALPPSIAWLDGAVTTFSDTANTRNHTQAGGMTVIHAFNGDNANTDDDDNSGILLRIFLLDTDYINFAAFHTCTIFTESARVVQTVHVTTRSPHPLNNAQRQYIGQRAGLGRYGAASDNYGQMPFSKQHCPAVARIVIKQKRSSAKSSEMK